MDWDLKVPSWDLAEFDRATTEQNLSSVVAVPSGGSALQCPASGLECSVDLKLGGVSDSGSSYKWKEQPGTSSTTMVSSSGPSKRQRALSNESQCALCLVEGCKADLSKCREYHRRHKVCEVHSKTPVVMVGGQEQRFCQQCSRFHLLVEFDEVKRSCRKRLDRHNRRRRKPQPNSLNSGNRFLAYPEVFPTTTAERNWAGIVKTEDNAGYTRCTVPDLPFFSNSSQSYSKERKQFPFFQESETSLSSMTTVGSLVGQTHLMSSTLSGVGSSNNMISNGQTQVFHSDCALSLLSSPTQTPAINLSHRISSANRIPMGQPLVPSSQYGDLARYSCSASENVSPTRYSCLVLGDNHASAVLVSDANDADIHCQSVFHIGGEGSSDGTPQALPFTWQ